MGLPGVSLQSLSPSLRADLSGIDIVASSVLRTSMTTENKISKKIWWRQTVKHIQSNRYSHRIVL